MSLAEIEALKAKGQPMQAKMDLARRIVSDFHSKEAAEEAARHFDSVIRKKELPRDIEERVFPAGTYPLSSLLVSAGLASSKSEALRLIEQGAVYLDGIRVQGGDVQLKLDSVLKVGKRRFVRLVVKA